MLKKFNFWENGLGDFLYTIIWYIMVLEMSPKLAKKFICEKCNYSCNKESDFKKHLSTRKHKMVYNDIQKTRQNSPNFVCSCGRVYKHASGLYRHKKTCIFDEKNEKIEKIENFEKNEKIEKNENIENIENTENIIIIEKDKKIKDDDKDDYKEMNKAMMEKNNELQSALLEVIPKIGDTTTNSHNTNNFNINVFLNEQCKDAINIMDFVQSLQLQLTDLENMGKLGFVEGTSKIFINGLKELDLHKRPIHCSDIKQETLYIKDNNMWQQENGNKDTMRMAIDEINKANIKQLPKWISENPTYADDEEYMKIISNIMKADIEEDKNKIINNVAKETLIDE
jgi:hypothetical protein